MDKPDYFVIGFFIGIFLVAFILFLATWGDNDLIDMKSYGTEFCKQYGLEYNKREFKKITIEGQPAIIPVIYCKRASTEILDDLIKIGP